MPAEKQHPRDMDKLTNSNLSVDSYLKQAEHAVECLKSGRTKAQRCIAELKQRKTNLKFTSQNAINELLAIEKQLRAAQVVLDVIEPRLETARADLRKVRVCQLQADSPSIIREDEG